MTNYIIGHLPFASSRLTDDRGLIDASRSHQTDQRLAELVRVDEIIASACSRLYCDIGAYLRAPDGPAANLIPVFDQ